jgi:hypothetical protein
MIGTAFFVLFVLMAMDSGIVALRPSSLVIGNALRSRSFRLHAKGFAPVPKPKATEEVAVDTTTPDEPTIAMPVIDGTKLTDEEKILNTKMFKRKEDRREIDLQE